MDPGLLAWSVLTAWALLSAAVAWCRSAGFRDGDIWAGAAIRVARLYSRLFHRLRIEGREHVPVRPSDGVGERPLIVIANHTAGVDPVLIQAALPFEIRWMMAEDMRLPALQWLWDFGRIIFVDRGRGGSAGLREALRHLKTNATLGIFPEGGIERPPRRIMPFREGIGVMIERTDALVLPLIIDGTPQVDPAWASLWRPSRARVRFLPVIDFAAQGAQAQAIAAELRELYLRQTGWPANDQPADPDAPDRGSVRNGPDAAPPRDGT
ncbi:MAG: lysophospholipid acyltransferase family protein [Planctomycetota bacterium]|nr:lysophospholipid acyltransferase family protein [Planctomycetota bacterium]